MTDLEFNKLHPIVQWFINKNGYRYQEINDHQLLVTLTLNDLSLLVAEIETKVTNALVAVVPYTID